MSSFSERLLSERKHLGLSQESFGALAGITKFSQLNYEKGLRSPDAAYLEALAKHGVDVQFLLTGVRAFDQNTSVQHTYCEKLHERLTQERKRLGLTPKQLADKTGISELGVRQMERGEISARAEDLQALHRAGVDVGYVLLSIAKNDGTQTLTSDEQALLETYRAAPNEQAKTTARNVLAAAVGSF